MPKFTIQLKLVQSMVSNRFVQIMRYQGNTYLFLCVATDTEAHDNGIVRAINSTYTANERVVGEARHTVFVGRLHKKTDEVNS